MNTSEARPLRPGEVEVRMLASRESVAGLRTFAADLAMRQDHDLDTIDDLRLVVDEVCAILIADAAPDSVLTFRLFVGLDRIQIAASVPLPGSDEPIGKPLSARILRTLADVFECDTDGYGLNRVLDLSFGKMVPRT